MKRTRIDLESIADSANLAVALHKAAKGKRFRSDVAAFIADADARLHQLGNDIRVGRLPYGKFHCFRIFDPKERLIHAACFEDRVFHHGVMNFAGIVLERAMHPCSFACRPGKGVHKAAMQVQSNMQRFKWYCQIDIAGYFDSISHDLVLQVLSRRFKGKVFERQLQRILGCYATEPGKGLPIGSLTSQYFANYYLDGLDRFLANDDRVRSHVRYMDDVVFWGDSKMMVQSILQAVCCYLASERDLTIKPGIQIHRSVQGITYCGFRILQGTVRLSRRRKRRYLTRWQFWEQLYEQGGIDGRGLQTAYAAVHAITAGTNSTAWRRENLRRHPPLEV